MDGDPEPDWPADVPVAARDAIRLLVGAVRASPHNLVSRRARSELWTRHVPECVDLGRLLPDDPGHVVDIGSGGGFPGLVVAAVRPQGRYTLVEATAKKARHLAATAAAMGVEVEVVDQRVEDLAGLLRPADIVTARAVAPLRTLVGYAMPLLRPRGRLLALKGRRWQDEVAEARVELRRSGARVVGLADPPAFPVARPPATVVIVERRK